MPAQAAASGVGPSGRRPATASTAPNTPSATASAPAPSAARASSFAATARPREGTAVRLARRPAARSSSTASPQTMADMSGMRAPRNWAQASAPSAGSHRVTEKYSPQARPAAKPQTRCTAVSGERARRRASESRARGRVMRGIGSESRVMAITSPRSARTRPRPPP